MSIKNLPDYDALYNKKLNELKKERDVLLKNLDILFLRSLETNDHSSREKIVSKKNSLRNFPDEMKKIEFENFEDLNKWIPECFNIN